MKHIINNRESFMKKYVVLAIETVIVILLTCHVLLVPYIDQLVWKRIFNISVVLLMGASAFVACKLSGIEIDFEWKNYKQYLFGIGIAIVLAFFIGVVPVWCGISFIGSHTDFQVGAFLYSIFYYFLLVGPVEELIFRVYYQKFFVGVFQKHRWIGVILASLLFGLWHIINGSWVQVLFTFGIGAVFGFAKEYLKDMHYPGVSLAHGSYDFILNCLRYFLL